MLAGETEVPVTGRKHHDDLVGYSGGNGSGERQVGCTQRTKLLAATPTAGDNVRRETDGGVEGTDGVDEVDLHWQQINIGSDGKDVRRLAGAVTAFVLERESSGRAESDRCHAVTAPGEEGMLEMAGIDHGNLDAFAGGAAAMRLIGIATERNAGGDVEVPISLQRRIHRGGHVVARLFECDAFEKIGEARTASTNQARQICGRRIEEGSCIFPRWLDDIAFFGGDCGAEGGFIGLAAAGDVDGLLGYLQDREPGVGKSRCGPVQQVGLLLNT